MNQRTLLTFFISFFIGIAIVQALPAHAAVLSILPYPSAQRKEVAVVLNTEGASVNAVQAHLTFDPSQFSIAGVSDGGSIVNFWVVSPTFSNTSGTVDFSGIVPGGITTASGTVIMITIIPNAAAATGTFTVASAEVLLNDGAGTSAPLSFVNAPFALTAASSSGPTANPIGPVDTEPPDPFVPQVARDPNLFNDQYFLVFSTTDGQSGIAEYEVLETKFPTWQVATSPYLLKDQSLSSNIYVRAVDKAGNFRTVELAAEHPASPAWPRAEAIALTGSGILLLVAVIFLWHKRSRRA